MTTAQVREGASQTAAQRGGHLKDRDRPLSDAQRDRFEDLLRRLTQERADIREAMVFALDNTECATEVRAALPAQMCLPCRGCVCWQPGSPTLTPPSCTWLGLLPSTGPSAGNSERAAARQPHEMTGVLWQLGLLAWLAGAGGPGSGSAECSILRQAAC